MPRDWYGGRCRLGSAGRPGAGRLPCELACRADCAVRASVGSDSPWHSESAGAITRMSHLSSSGRVSTISHAVIVPVRGSNSYQVLRSRLKPPVTRPLLDLHSREDQLLYVLEGTLLVQIGEERRELGAGGFAWIPRDTLHTFANAAGIPCAAWPWPYPAISKSCSPTWASTSPRCVARRTWRNWPHRRPPRRPPARATNHRPLRSPLAPHPDRACRGSDWPPGKETCPHSQPNLERMWWNCPLSGRP